MEVRKLGYRHWLFQREPNGARRPRIDPSLCKQRAVVIDRDAIGIYSQGKWRPLSTGSCQLIQVLRVGFRQQFVKPSGQGGALTVTQGFKKDCFVTLIPPETTIDEAASPRPLKLFTTIDSPGNRCIVWCCAFIQLVHCHDKQGFQDSIFCFQRPLKKLARDAFVERP